MSNPFERHGIGHLSASSLNLWAAEPALWIMERLLGRRSPSGIPAARGKAVEAGVNIGLHDPTLPLEACIAEAESAFDRETALNPDPRRDDERKKLPKTTGEKSLDDALKGMIREQAKAKGFDVPTEKK